jgi:hypothetical protein
MPEHALENTEFTLAEEACMSRCQVRIMRVCFFSYKDISHYEFIAQGQTANQQCYLEMLTSLWQSVQKERLKLWPDKWILHHDNASVHDALSVHEFLANKFALFTCLSCL